MKILTSLILLSFTLNVSAQNSKALYSLSILSPSLGFEKNTSEKSSLKFSIGSLTGIGSKDGFQTKTIEIRGEYRHYYNLEKRGDEGRLSTNYSGNYLGIFAEPSYIFVKGDEATNIYAGGVWGIQRNYSSHFHLDLSLNAGLGKNGFETKAGLRLGFWLK